MQQKQCCYSWVTKPLPLFKTRQKRWEPNDFINFHIWNSHSCLFFHWICNKNVIENAFRFDGWERKCMSVFFWRRDYILNSRVAGICFCISDVQISLLAHLDFIDVRFCKQNGMLRLWFLCPEKIRARYLAKLWTLDSFCDTYTQSHCMCIFWSQLKCLLWLHQPTVDSGQQNVLLGFYWDHMINLYIALLSG